MSAGPYEPPRQSGRGQFVDAVVILVLIFATLFLTTYLTSDDAGGPPAAPVQSVQQLPASPGEQAQYQKVIDSGTADLPTVAADVSANQPSTEKYDIPIPTLVGTVLLLALYLGFVYRTSFREYREVIEEKFGPRPGSGTGAEAGSDR